MSDATHPVVYNPARPIDITLDENDNPFVIEGELYDASKGESITIRYADGKYYKKNRLLSVMPTGSTIKKLST